MQNLEEAFWKFLIFQLIEQQSRIDISHQITCDSSNSFPVFHFKEVPNYLNYQRSEIQSFLEESYGKITFGVCFLIKSEKFQKTLLWVHLV